MISFRFLNKKIINLSLSFAKILHLIYCPNMKYCLGVSYIFTNKMDCKARNKIISRKVNIYINESNYYFLHSHLSLVCLLSLMLFLHHIILIPSNVNLELQMYMLMNSKDNHFFVQPSACMAPLKGPS